MADEWLETLDPTNRAWAEELIEQFQAVGVSDPVGRARAEIEEDVPQLVRSVILKHFWTEAINPPRDNLDWIDNLVRDARRDPTGPFADAGRALERILECGADRKDIGSVARFIAYEAVFSVIHTLDYGYDPERDDDLPGWALVERDPRGVIGDREIDDLHQNLLEFDPSGREGRPA